MLNIVIDTEMNPSRFRQDVLLALLGQQTTINCQPLQNQPQVQRAALSVVTTLHLVTEHREVRIQRLGLFQAIRRQFWQELLPSELSIRLG